MTPISNHKTFPNVSFIFTDHFVERMKTRLPADFEFPPVGSFVRLLTVEDTLQEKRMLLLLVKGGAIVCRWHGPLNQIVVITAYDDDQLHRLQARRNSRFMPVNSRCYEVASIVLPAKTMVNAA